MRASRKKPTRLPIIAARLKTIAERAPLVVAEYQDRLRQRIEGGLADLGERVVLHSRAAERTPTLFFTLPGGDARAVAAKLAAADVLAPAGTFYAHEPFRALGLDVDAGIRVGVAPYTDDSDVDRLLTGLGEALR